MKTTKNIATIAVASFALLIAAPASAASRPGKEVRINTENLAKLPIQD